MPNDPQMRVMVDCTPALIDRLDRIERAIAFRPGWIAGYVALGRYIGSSDKQGRKAKAWAVAEKLPCKLIDGVPHFSLVDVDRAMRNGRRIETGRGAA